MATSNPEQQPAGHIIAAWLVHAFTASGAVLALFALFAVESSAFSLALLLLGAALAVDGIDGTFARMARVETQLPRINGATLDLVIDYLTYVFVPTVFMLRAELIPAEWGLALAAAIQISSLYVFARTDMKTPDGYFRGFPALWNLVALYLWVTVATPMVGAVTVVVLVAMTFAPVHVIHPIRARDYGWLPPLLAGSWAITTCALLWPVWSDWAWRAWLVASLGSAALLIALGLLRTVRGQRFFPEAWDQLNN